MVIGLLLVGMIGQLLTSVVWACPMGSALSGSEDISLELVVQQDVFNSIPATAAITPDVDSAPSNCCQEATGCITGGCMGMALSEPLLSVIIASRFIVRAGALDPSFVSLPPSSVYRPPITG